MAPATIFDGFEEWGATKMALAVVEQQSLANPVV
jgi:hypothetical protein